MIRNKANRRHDRATNWSKLRTDLLQSILNDPYTRGIDGQDYHPYLEELQSELYSRTNKAQAELMASYDRDQKAYIKFLATSHKRTKIA